MFLIVTVCLQLVSLQEAKLLLKEDDDLIKEVFDYWSRKRKTCKGGSLIPTVKQEKRDGSSTSDPYVAFRRRTEKMQTRKNDEASYEKMLKLRRDLSRTVTILEMIKKREKVKRELLHLTLEVVEKRNVMPDFGTEVMAEAQQRALVKPIYTIPIIPLSNSNQYRHQDHHMDMKDYKKVRPYTASLLQGGAVPLGPLCSILRTSTSMISPAQTKSHSHRYSDKTGNWPWVSPSEGGLGDPRYRYCLTSLNTPWRCIGLARRRVGRGGRALMDRAHTDLAIIQSMDSDPEPEPLASTLLSSPLRSSNTSTSETNTSDPDGSFSFPQPSSSPPSSSTHLNLSRILLNIKACRWRHFRPRTLSQHPAGGGDISRSGFKDFGRTVSGLTRTLSGGSISQNRTGPTTTPVNGESFFSPLCCLEFVLSDCSCSLCCFMMLVLERKFSWPHKKLF
ncbi:hypothetical protein XENOCAPTIV_000344 [Xenoophorus captivus]|uniref:Uncharacterized protein n=1 Tax=Xenoophorus captivus TaxID=1517983 RepID=A0ABV0QYV2_9TELE